MHSITKMIVYMFDWPIFFFAKSCGKKIIGHFIFFSCSCIFFLIFLSTYLSYEFYVFVCKFCKLYFINYYLHINYNINAIFIFEGINVFFLTNELIMYLLFP